MSENRISNSHELNNTDHTTGKNNYNAISNNGSPEFKTVGNSKKGFLEKTLYSNIILNTSATLQACAGAPLGRCGSFESYNSEIEPMHPLSSTSLLKVF